MKQDINPIEMETDSNRFVLVRAEDLNQIKLSLLRMEELLERRHTFNASNQKKKYITAQEFMDSLSISRSTFDQLRDDNKIKVIQKGRKLYLPSDEIDRYMND